MIRVKCDKCGGTGKAPLSETLQGMLENVKAFPGYSAAWHGARHPFVGITAFNNRLEDLRALGLVRRERLGRSWLYYPVKGKRWLLE